MQIFAQVLKFENATFRKFDPAWVLDDATSDLERISMK